MGCTPTTKGGRTLQCIGQWVAPQKETVFTGFTRTTWKASLRTIQQIPHNLTLHPNQIQHSRLQHSHASNSIKCTGWHTIKTTRYAKEKTMTRNRERKTSIQLSIHPEMTEMMAWTLKIYTTNVFHTFKRRGKHGKKRNGRCKRPQLKF